jgi:hypothetical protein
VEVVVTATNASYTGGGSAQATSAPTGLVASLTNVSAPTISGTTQDGQTLTASAGSWTGLPSPSFSYQWERCTALDTSCQPITGATSATYSLTDADVGSVVQAQVTATNVGGSLAA